MINVESGHLKLSDTQTITPFSNLETIQCMDLGQLQELKELKNGWTLYHVKNLKVDANYFNLSFLFEQGKMTGISFVFQEHKFDLELKSWSSWSENAERANAARFNDWLDIVLPGKDRHFNWGIIQAVYDSKSGFSSINIKYHDIDDSIS